MGTLEESAARKKRRDANYHGPPRRENYDPGGFGDTQFEWAQDRYVMERGNAYSAAHANDGKL